jgi:predicted ATPase/DNA-binding SARP family transcriptional activator/Tfp pilus assembly protein PilF
MATPWQIELLGGLRASHGTTVVSRFRTQKTAALLAYLALYPEHPHPRDTLIDLLWPDDPLDTGRNKLRQALTSLRYQLEPPGTPRGAFLNADRTAVHLGRDLFTTDVALMEARLQQAARATSPPERSHHLAEAAELYRGDLLPGHFDPWVLTERQRLQEAYLAALGQLVSLLEDAGEPERAREYAWLAVRSDPLREEGQHSLIRLLLRLGETGAARRQYQEWERLLEEELGEEPGPAMQALLDASERDGSRVRVPSGRQASGDAAAAPHTRVIVDRQAMEAAPHPTGTVSFLAAEIVDTTRWNAASGTEAGAGRSAAEPALAPLSSISSGMIELLGPLFRGHGGHEVRASEETISVAFGRASDAMAAALAAREAIARLQWSGRGPEGADASSTGRGAMESGEPGAEAVAVRLQHEAYRLRAAIHTGEVEPGEEITRSPLLSHAQQIMLAAHPGQIVLSERCAVLVQGHQPSDIRCQDLGRYRLSQQSQPERFFLAADPRQPMEPFPPLLALPEHTGNLPLLFSRFHGRSDDLAILEQLLLPAPCPPDAASTSDPLPSPPPPPVRLVTLTGPGGSGKSRLALEAAHRLRPHFRGAAWFVPLADLGDARLLFDRVLDALRLPASPHLDPLEQASAFLSRQPSLVLLDNLEHLLPAAAPLLRDLLDRTPTLSLLVTSRQTLQIMGEQELPVAPLPLPVPDGARSDTASLAPDSLVDCASVALFVDRARAVRPDFQVTPANAAVIARLCTRLEGLPLAIELAAARAGVLNLAQILARLEQRFELLVSRQRDASPRHQSLRAAIDWSYQLLPAELQRFFSRLSAFRGGWTLEAAEAVCLPGQADTNPREGSVPARDPHSPAADYLEQLRQCSLVVVDEEYGEVRFRLLETLREFGAEQVAADESSDLRRCHAAYYQALAEQLDREFTSPRQAELIRLAGQEMPNIRAALAWTMEAGEAEVGLRMAASLKHGWHTCCHWREGVQWLEGLLGVPAAQTETPTRAKALEVTAALAYLQGDIPTAERYAQACIDLARRLVDLLDLANGLNIMGDIVLWRDGPDRAQALFEEALTLHRQLGDVWGSAISLNNLAMLETRRADYASAEILYRESFQLHRQLGDQRGMGAVLGALGTLAQRAGNYRTARARCEEALEILRPLGYHRGVAWALNNLGSVATDEGDLRTARSCYEQSLAICRSSDNTWGIGWCILCLGDIARLEGQLHQARSLYEEALIVQRELENVASVAKALNGLGLVALHEGNRSEAAARCRESLRLRFERDDQSGVVECLNAIAAIAAANGDAERAARLLGCEDKLRSAIRAPLPPSEAPALASVAEAARAALGETAFQAARDLGRSLSPPEAVALALEAA